MKKLFMIIVVLSISLILNSQIIESAFSPNLLTSSFLNPDNLSMSHTVRFSGGVASGSQSFYESVYTNHLSYKFTPRLKLNVDLNFVNFGTATYKNGIEFEGNNDNTSRVIPNFQLNWKPSENTSISIEYRQYNTQYPFFPRTNF